MPDLSFLIPSTINHLTFHHLRSLKHLYVFIYIQLLCLSVLPLKEEDILPSQLHLLGRGRLTHPEVPGVNLQLGGMFLAKWVHYPKKSLRVIQVLHHVVDGHENLLGMAPDLIRLFHLFSRVHAFEVCEVGLGVWVLGKHPVEK